MLDVIARHDGVVVVNKPAGLASTGRDLDDPDCAQGKLMEMLGRRRVWAVHQLDKLTSGLNVFVLRKALVAEWAERLRHPNATKTYLAVCAGAWPGGEAALHVREPIGRVSRGRKTFSAIAADGKPAHSVLRCLETHPDATLVEVELRTGRTHQVRLHAASVGLPVIGDPLHGALVPAVADAGMGLHAWRLTVDDAPAPLQRLVAPVPARLLHLAGKLGLSFWQENR